METVNTTPVFSGLDDLRTAVYGKPMPVLSNCDLLKFPKHKHRYGNGYVIKHSNEKDIVLVDTVHQVHEHELEKLVEKGYNIRALLITHQHLLSQSYKPVHEIAASLNTNYYIHPLDSENHGLDITAYNDVFKDFDLTVFHTPGHTAGSVVIFCGINDGLFTGDSAVGSTYESDDYSFVRPPIEEDLQDVALRESWMSISVPFKHVLPLHGKPEFNINEIRRNQILSQLVKSESTKNL